MYVANPLRGRARGIHIPGGQNPPQRNIQGGGRGVPARGFGGLGGPPAGSPGLGGIEVRLAFNLL